MSSENKLLFVGAHPDDETFGPGATLAHYARLGVKVYYICATGGESGTVNKSHLKNSISIHELRNAELKCAVKELRLSGLFLLGYRDSGMPGSPDNTHPKSLSMAPINEVVSRLVKVIRDIKPQVILTHEPGGDYGHLDHIIVNKATTAAFKASGDSAQFPETGQPFQPQKLYYNVFSHRLLKLMVKILPLLGRNPKRFGRNHDIDLTVIVNHTLPVTTKIKLDKQAVKMQRVAASCHRSQMEGTSLRRLLSALLDRFGLNQGLFHLALTTKQQSIETDLFESVRHHTS